MTIDEAKEREAFLKWNLSPHAECLPQHAVPFAAWLARAAQPVRVSREALESALLTIANPDEKHLTKKVADRFTPVLHALNIEVTDK